LWCCRRTNHRIDILYVKGNEPLRGNETPEKDSTGEIKDIKNSDGKQLEHKSSLEEGRTVRKATGPLLELDGVSLLFSSVCFSNNSSPDSSREISFPILYVKGNEPLSGNETPEKDSTGEIKDIKNSHGKQLEHNSSLEEGRTVRKATGHSLY
jgi:hypothetical protein